MAPASSRSGAAAASNFCSHDILLSVTAMHFVAENLEAFCIEGRKEAWRMDKESFEFREEKTFQKKG